MTLSASGKTATDIDDTVNFTRGEPRNNLDDFICNLNFPQVTSLKVYVLHWFTPVLPMDRLGVLLKSVC